MTPISDSKTTPDCETKGASEDNINVDAPRAQSHWFHPRESGTLERYINFAAVANFGVIILASWEAFAVSFQLSLLNGGPASIFYGSILASLGACAIGFSLAELASIDPTVGAQYRWSANLAPFEPRFWGLLQGWITTAAYCFVCAAPPSILANIITSLAIFNYETYVPERWHTSLIMIAIMIVPMTINLWFRKVIDVLETTGGLLHLALFIVFIAVLALGPRSDSDFVFKTLTADVSGWNNAGVSFGIGLLSMTFSLAGADSVLHMCDEVKHARRRVPRAIILTSTANPVLLIIFATILLFYMGPLEDILDKPLPIIWILYRATESKAAANALTSLVGIFFFFNAFNIYASVSRLVWAFACDNGLPFSTFFAYVHPTLKLPTNALWLVATIVTCLSLIYIGSATAFNALISLQTLSIHVSYFFPILFILIRKLRGRPPAYGPFKMGNVGVPVNIFALVYLVFVVTWMPFPATMPITKDTMNYAGPIFGAAVLGALGHWFIRAKKTFNMPVNRYE